MVGAGLLAASWGKKGEAEAVKSSDPPNQTPQRISADELRRLTLAPEAYQPRVKVQGKVIADRESQLSAKVSGLIELAKRESSRGAFVKSGEVLFQLDDSPYSTTLAERESELADAEYKLAEAQQKSREWKRMSHQSSQSQPHLIAAVARVKAAKAQLAQAKLDFEATQVRAPFDAVVIEKLAEQGEYVAAGEPLIHLVAIDQVKVRMPVDRNTATQIALAAGESFELTSPNHAHVWVAKFEYIEPIIDETCYQLCLVASVSEPNLDDVQRALALGSMVESSLPLHRIDKAYRIPSAMLAADQSVLSLNTAGDLERLIVKPISQDQAKREVWVELPQALDNLTLVSAGAQPVKTK